jgi:pilus assembly protein CpaE
MGVKVMSTVTKEQFEFDGEAELSEEELRALEELDADLDLDFDDELEGENEGLWDEAEDTPPEETVEDLDDLEAALADNGSDNAADLPEDDAFAGESSLDDAGPEFAEDGELPAFADDNEEMPGDEHEPTADQDGTDLVSLATSVPDFSDHEDDFEDMRMDEDHRPVPRINIDVFCESTEFSNMMEKAALDRRLAKAHVTIMSGGIQKAAEYFRSQNTPNLVILESLKGGESLMDGLNKLAEVCDPSTRVVVVGHINDIRLYRDLIDKGVSEYLITPRSPVTIINTISNLYVDPSAPPIGRNIAFVGARGGVGSSTICHNVAWAIAEDFKSNAVLMDLDLPFGTASLDLEQDPSQGLAEALSAPERLDDVLLDRLLQKVSDRLSLFAAPNLLDREYSMPDSAYETVLDIVRTTAPNIIIDVPHVWNGWARYVLQSADEIIITATPDLASFRNAKNIVEALAAHRANDAAPTLVLNQVNVPKRIEVPAEQFKEALGFGPSVVIDWDPQLFGNASANGQTLMEAGPKSSVANAVTNIAATILGQSPVHQSKGFSLASLFGKR